MVDQDKIILMSKIALYEKEFADVCSCKYFTEPSLLFADWQDKYLDVKVFALFLFSSCEYPPNIFLVEAVADGAAVYSPLAI